MLGVERIRFAPRRCARVAGPAEFGPADQPLVATTTRGSRNEQRPQAFRLKLRESLPERVQHRPDRQCVLTATLADEVDQPSPLQIEVTDTESRDLLAPKPAEEREARARPRPLRRAHPTTSRTRHRTPVAADGCAPPACTPDTPGSERPRRSFGANRRNLGSPTRRDARSPASPDDRTPEQHEGAATTLRSRPSSPPRAHGHAHTHQRTRNTPVDRARPCSAQALSTRSSSRANRQPAIPSALVPRPCATASPPKGTKVLSPTCLGRSTHRIQATKHHNWLLYVLSTADNQGGQALVAQGIEHRFPKPCAQVRILAGALL